MHVGRGGREGEGGEERYCKKKKKREREHDGNGEFALCGNISLVRG